MLNFDFLDKGLGIVVSPAHFSCYILLNDHMSLPGCLYIMRYWAICAIAILKLFVTQVVTPWSLKLTLSF